MRRNQRIGHGWTPAASHGATEHGRRNSPSASSVEQVMSGVRRSAVALLVLLAAAACAGASPSASADPAPPVADPPPGPGIGEVRYSCDEPPGFALSLLEQPAEAEREAHPSAEALRLAIAQGGPDLDMLSDSGYWLVSRDAARAQYLARGPGGQEPPFVEATVELEDGAWRLAGWGQCRPTIVLDGLSLATWTLDPAVPMPGPDATTFTALVTERACTGGQAMGARLLPPSITYDEDTISVVFAARPLAGDSFDCPGNPATRVVVELREPLGDHRLLDAGLFPPADPSVPAS